jgi:chorismate mutase-like protein
MAKELEKLRVEIDALDKKIQSLIGSRAELASAVAEVKKTAEYSSSFYRPEREAQVLRTIIERNDNLVKDKDMAHIFREIMSACLALEQGINVAYLGPEGTFTQAAALKHFGHAVSTLDCGSVELKYRQLRLLICLTYQQYSHPPQPVWLRFDLPYSEYFDVQLPNESPLFSAFLPLENSLNLKYYHFQDSPLLGLQPSSHSCLLPQLLMPLNVAKQSLYRGLFYHQLENPSPNIVDMLNKSRDEVAYTLVDIEGGVSDTVVNNLKQVEGILMVRPLENSLNLKYYHFQDSLLLGLQPSSHSCLLPQLLMPLNVAKQSLYRGLFYHQLENPSHNI